jgi:uncharacterized membrane protein YdjX (TVP38/TMEM64 family)
MTRRNIFRLLIVGILIGIGVSLQIAGFLDAQKMLELARGYADQWWLILLLILLQGILFTFALAGSLFLWVAAPIYSPPMATFILAAGGTLGGLGAYFFSQRLTDDWIEKIEKSRSYKLLQKQDNFFTLFAMRVFPAFPHSLVNFSSGILKVKLSHFLAAAALGIAIKSYVYSRVIYGAASAASIDELFDPAIFGPLILLSVISFAVVLVKYRLSR